MDGFLNLNKPKGITSAKAVEEVKKILGVRKAGHAGTLDPHATGVLVIGIGKATKLLPFITEREKEYVATVQLGVETDTLDPEGQIIWRAPVPQLSPEDFKKALNKFIGEIEQVPPAYSAVRVQGERLYALAREGIWVQVRPKKVYVYELELLEFKGEEAVIRAVVSKGTYIRALVRDIARELGTRGIVKELVRTRVGHFKIESAVPLEPEEVRRGLLSPDHGVAHLPPVKISAEKVFRQGGRVPLRAVVEKPVRMRAWQEVRVYNQEGKFLGVGIWVPGGVRPKRVF